MNTISWDDIMDEVIKEWESKMKFTPENITELEPNQVFVFGSNSLGRHGIGAAHVAMKFGAKYGIAKGRQGQTYAIITKHLNQGTRSVPLREIESQIKEFLEYAAENSNLEFLVTKIGCGLGGYTPQHISPLFMTYDIPDNVILPREFWVQ